MCIGVHNVHIVNRILQTLAGSKQRELRRTHTPGDVQELILSGLPVSV